MYLLLAYSYSFPLLYLLFPPGSVIYVVLCDPLGCVLSFMVDIFQVSLFFLEAKAKI